MILPKINSLEDTKRLIDEIGILPLFKNEISGFSIEEAVNPYLWFNDEVDGPWEWKGPIASNKKYIYGKFFHSKAAFIRRDLFPDFANFRRNGEDFEEHHSNGYATNAERLLWNVIDSEGPIVSRDLKVRTYFTKEGHKGFDGTTIRLQMKTYVSIEDFTYPVTKDGRSFGWGLAVYSTPEKKWGEDYVSSVYNKHSPAESMCIIQDHVMRITGIDEEGAARFIRG